MLTSNGFGTGLCTLCCQETEVLQATFKDGLSGRFCRKHFWEMVKVRGENGKATDAPETGTSGRKA